METRSISEFKRQVKALIKDRDAEENEFLLADLKGFVGALHESRGKIRELQRDLEQVKKRDMKRFRIKVFKSIRSRQGIGRLVLYVDGIHDDTWRHICDEGDVEEFNAFTTRPGWTERVMITRSSRLRRLLGPFYQRSRLRRSKQTQKFEKTYWKAASTPEKPFIIMYNPSQQRLLFSQESVPAELCRGQIADYEPLIEREINFKLATHRRRWLHRREDVGHMRSKLAKIRHAEPAVPVADLVDIDQQHLPMDFQIQDDVFVANESIQETGLAIAASFLQRTVREMAQWGGLLD